MAKPNKLAAAIAAKKLERKIPIRVIAEELGEIGGRFVTQQSVSTWMKDTTPSEMFHDALATWLEIGVTELRTMIGEDATGPFSGYPRAGIVSNRKTGKFKFKAIPAADYVVKINTGVMEPALPVGALAIVSARAAAVGQEVIAHMPDGIAWVGVWDGDKLVRYLAEPARIDGALAIHPIIAASRPA